EVDRPRRPVLDEVLGDAEPRAVDEPVGGDREGGEPDGGDEDRSEAGGWHGTNTGNEERLLAASRRRAVLSPLSPPGPRLRPSSGPEGARRAASAARPSPPPCG